MATRSSTKTMEQKQKKKCLFTVKTQRFSINKKPTDWYDFFRFPRAQPHFEYIPEKWKKCIHIIDITETNKKIYLNIYFSFSW